MPVIKGGSSGLVAEVNKAFQLLVRAVTEPETEDAAEDGQLYIWTSGNLDIDAADTMLLVKNTSDTNLHISALILSSGNVNTRYTVHYPTTDVTVVAGAGGAIVVGVNSNTGSANVADASAASDETGNTQGDVLFDISQLALTTQGFPTPGLILAKNKSIAVDQVTESTAGSATFIGHYELSL